ncbi:hypothetical protein QUB47_07095 [Microcoleus sp. AT9_B5]
MTDNNIQEDFSPYFSEVEHYQEKLYLGEWEIPVLMSSLESKIFDLLSKPDALLEVLAILRILREADDPSIPGSLFELIERTFEKDEMYGSDIWLADIGRILILEFLDIIAEYKRPEDIPRLMQMLCWDVFHIPSHILMLIRKHHWHQLWDAINGRYNIQEVYDPMFRTQHYLTREAFKNETASESQLLKSHQKELLALRQTLRSATTPVLYVEGKTDRMILETAYRKLFPEEKMPFAVKECDVVGGSNGGAGGAQTLARLISSIRPDSSHPALALFDHDKEGVDAFNKLPGYFINREQPKYRPGKISQSGRSAALILPAPKGREKYAELMNLSIEFLFDDETLEVKTPSGQGLVFSYPDLEIRVKRHGNPIVEVRKSNLLETREITDGKLVFANEIVPLLEANRFLGFRKLFWIVKDILLTDMKPRAESKE